MKWDMMRMAAFRTGFNGVRRKRDFEVGNLN